MIKVAIIGAGAISATHIEAYLAQSDRVKLLLFQMYMWSGLKH